MGAERIVVADVIDRRLEKALQLGAWHVINGRKEDTVDRSRALFGGDGAVQKGGDFKLAASAEFIERPDALPAFEKAYDFTLKQNQLLSLAGGDTAVTIKAAAQQTSGVNAAMAYGTDGPVAALGLQTLSDPKGVQPIYAPAPVVREAVLKEYPQIADWLQPVFASLDEKTLQKLNASIAVEGLDAKKVAADYLQQKGLLK